LAGLVEGQVVTFVEVGLAQQHNGFTVHKEQTTRQVVARDRNNLQRLADIRLGKST
jgi:hypothetical protein